MASSPRGYFSFVLHSHLPYVRQAGRWPHGEEMLYEALAESYLPLLAALDDLQHEGFSPRLTIGLTPILLEQIADPQVLENFAAYLQEEITAARTDADRYHRTAPDLAALARFYEAWYEQIRRTFEDRYQREVVGAFRRLAQAGVLDLLTSAATHAYLPLLSRDSSVAAQLRVGVETSARHFGWRPQGIWLPECGYRPAVLTPDGRAVRPGLETFLAELGLRYFFTDTHALQGGQPVGKAAGAAVGLYLTPAAGRPAVVPAPPAPRSTLRPYFVGQSTVAVFSREARTGLQVWSADYGYPGDPVYREFHRKDPGSGLQYWRVTGRDVPLADKQVYDPARAFARAMDHAEHFVRLVAGILETAETPDGHPPIIVSAYDTELFGHWWFEGVAWLKEVLRRLSTHPTIRLTTVADYLQRHPPTLALDLPESSWGQGGGHWTWLNPETAWMWPLIHGAEERMERLVASHPVPSPDERPLLAQAGRELLLLQASDWPFLITTGQARAYAQRRFEQHLARFNRLALAAEIGDQSLATLEFLRLVAAQDNPFPFLDPAVFAPRTPQPVR